MVTKIFVIDKGTKGTIHDVIGYYVIVTFKTVPISMGGITPERSMDSINTRYNQNLHMPTTSLTMVQEGVLYSRGVGFTIVCC